MMTVENHARWSFYISQPLDSHSQPLSCLRCDNPPPGEGIIPSQSRRLA